MLPTEIPLFPLPNAVLFPGVSLPLHVFEPRYREMVADALTGDRVIGMVLLRPGWEPAYDQRPPVFDVGCAGIITHVETLPDGRYNMVLTGLEKFRIVAEDPRRPYRVATVESMDDALAPVDQEALEAERDRLGRTLAPLLARAEASLPDTLTPPALVNTLSQYLDLEPIERQALLECQGPLPRCRLLLEVVRMKVMQGHPRGGSPSVH